MDVPRHWIVLLLVICFSITHVTSLQCYACADTGSDNDCEQYKTFEEAFDGKRPNILKNCTAPYDQICYVETYANNGQQISHIRDCGDGRLFSFNAGVNDTSSFGRLLNMGVNNETACIFTGQNLICLSKCNSTDFCNGPSVDDVSNAYVHCASFSVIFALLIFYLLVIDV